MSVFEPERTSGVGVLPGFLGAAAAASPLERRRGRSNERAVIGDPQRQLAAERSARPGETTPRFSKACAIGLGSRAATRGSTEPQGRRQCRRDAQHTLSGTWSALAPDVLVATGGASAERLYCRRPERFRSCSQMPRSVGSGLSQVFEAVATPPDFVQFEDNLSGKWLERLKQIAPNVTNAAILWDPTRLAWIGQ